MARYPDAIWKPVERYNVGGPNHIAMAAHRRLVLHTAVFDGDSLFALFNTPGNPVAHFYVRKDGTVEQYVDTDIRSSAVLDGNPDSVTVETWDGGPSKFHGTDGPPWTPEQVDTLAVLARWVNTKHGIPLAQLPSSRPGTTGIGWHRQGIDGNFPPGILAGRAAGGESWSPSSGKSCPGDTRIRQVVDEVIPQAKNGDSGMSADDVKAINTNTDTGIAKVLEVVRNIETRERKRDARQFAALREQILAIPTSGGDPADFRAAVLDVLDKQLQLQP